MKLRQGKAWITLTMSCVVGLAGLILALAPGQARPLNAGKSSLAETSSSAQLKVHRGELPLSFERNVGQSDAEVKFLSRGSGYKLFLTADEAVLLLKSPVANRGMRNPKLALDVAMHRNFEQRKGREEPSQQAVLAMRLVGANRGAAVSGLNPFSGTSNYYVGNDPANWHRNVPNYAQVKYESIYPGVDLLYYGNQSRLEYDFVVAPGSDPSQIQLGFEAQPKLKHARIDQNGELVLAVEGREVRFRKPSVYQTTANSRTPIEGKYVLRAGNQVGFEVGPYDRSQALVIDPVLSYSSYLGGSAYDKAYGIAVDASGNILVAGTTESTNFPTANAYQAQNGGSEDVFVTKFNPSGTSLIYSTYLGGLNNDVCESLALSSSGNAYITGSTNSPNYPVLNAIQQNLAGSQNIFMSQLDPNGNLVSSTYYGGSSSDAAFGIAVDSSGVYVAGTTDSSNYPTVNPFQATLAGSQNAFLTKFATSGSSVIYSTYLGGSTGTSIAYSVAVDSSESAYVTGQTFSTNFPLMNPFQSQNKAHGTVFLTKFTSAGNALAYSTYLGGSNTESAYSVAVDASDSAYLAGATESTNFPTQNPFQASNAGEYDVFVTKFNSSGSALLYSTYIGGKFDEYGNAIAVDSSGNAHVSGYVFSNNFPVTSNAFQSQNNGVWNAFVLELNSAGNGLIYSSYLGGSATDLSDSIALDASGDTWVSGAASSTNFPVTGNAFQSTNAGGSDDAYLAEVSAVTSYPLTVSLAGTGSGTVSSTPVGISCGTVCSATFASGTVTLTANPVAGSTFTGWSGACSGEGVCTLNLTSSESVTATFGIPVFSLLNNLGTNGPNDPTNPTWPGIIAQGHDGNLYSTAPTALGGSEGAVFRFTPAGALTVLTTFSSDGAPQSGLTLGTDGNFYGTTFGCSVGGDGTVFKVTSTGTLTTVYSFTGGDDGKCPTAPPVLGSDGNYYGTTTTSNIGTVDGSTYKIVAGVFGTLHDFGSTNGSSPAGPLVLGINQGTGSLYGTTQAGGSTGHNAGVIYSSAPSGVFNLLFTFSGTNGQDSVAPLIQATDGNFYGTTQAGGTNGLGVVFKISPAGAFAVIHNFAGTGDGATPTGGLVQASDGNFYGTTSQAASGTGCGTIFRISNGVLATIYTFPSNGSSGCNPQATLVQHTNGTLYGTTNTGGSTIGGACAAGCGTFFSMSASLPPFISLLSTSGNVGSMVQILGQGFSGSSVVEFNGVPATKVTLSGTTFLTATVPAGASSGFVTVTTAGSTLTSLVKYVVHNAWSSGAPIPVAVAAPASGFISNNIYVVGGFETTSGGPVNNNQVYSTISNSWITMAPIPTPVYGAASAVVGNTLFVIGGFETSTGTPTNLVQIYNVLSNSWSSGAAMPTARGYAAAAVDAGLIWVMGGSGSSGLLSTAEAYTLSTNSWTEEPLMITAKSGLAAADLQTVVATDGLTASGDTGDNEGFNVTTNAWMTVTADPSPRNASCYAGLTQLYVAGGLNNANPQTASNVLDVYNEVTGKWTSLAPMPTAVFWPASALGNGLLYCIGGQTSAQGAAINNVQIYQP